MRAQSRPTHRRVAVTFAVASLGCLTCALVVACGLSASGLLGPSVDGSSDAVDEFDAPAMTGDDTTGTADGDLVEAGADADADADADAAVDTDTGSMDAGSEVSSRSTDADADAGGVDAGDSGRADAGPACGNGVLDPGEQCDDGNVFNLDGCDSTCSYEVVTRMTLLSIQGTPAPAFCTPTTNRLGTQSFTAIALSQLNPDLQSGITNGTTNIFAQLIGLGDLTGVADTNGLSLGIASGQLDPARGTWPGNNPIDWWFLADHTTVGSSGLPTNVLTSGALAAGKLTTGPSNVDLPVPLGGNPAVMRVLGAYLSATINQSPAPNVPAPPPNLLAPGLTVFQTITADGTGQGLCGNITVESLANIPIPQTLTTGTTACSALCASSNSYTACAAGGAVGPGCNSLLDALVGGCAVGAPLCVPVVNQQQPDVPVTATVQTLTLGAGNKVPSGQTTGNNDAYSAYMKFDTNRAHITGENCAQTSDCQTGKTCMGGTCQ
jgi:cysteine-rich repeat protein